MEEGTFPPDPGSGVPSQQNPWETPPSSNPAQISTEKPVVSPESIKPHQVQPIVYRTNSDISQGDGEGKQRSFPLKKIFLIILAILLTLTVIATVIFMLTSSTSTEVSNDDVVELTYWGVFEDENVVRPIIDEFEKENPNIKVIYIKQDLVDYRDKLNARIENNKGPDIYRYHTSWYPMISNILLPLPQEVIEKDDFNSRYYNVIQNELIKNGSIIGVPLYTDTLSLYINNDLYNKISTDSANPTQIPRTWEEFIDASVALTEIDDNGAIVIGGAGIGTYNNVKYAPDILSLLMVQNGVDLNNIDDYGGEIAEAIKFYTNFSRVEDNVWDSTQNNSFDAFVQGKLAMFFGYSRDYSEIKRQNPNIQMSVVPVPQLVSDEPVNIASFWAEGVSTASKNPQEAFKFMNYLARGATQERLFEEASKSRDFGDPYSMISLASKLKDSVAFVFVDQSNDAITSPFVFVESAGENDRNKKLDNLLKEAVNNTLSRKDLDEEVEELLNGYNNL